MPAPGTEKKEAAALPDAATAASAETIAQPVPETSVAVFETQNDRLGGKPVPLETVTACG